MKNDRNTRLSLLGPGGDPCGGCPILLSYGTDWPAGGRRLWAYRHAPGCVVGRMTACEAVLQEVACRTQHPPIPSPGSGETDVDQASPAPACGRAHQPQPPPLRPEAPRSAVQCMADDPLPPPDDCPALCLAVVARVFPPSLKAPAILLWPARTAITSM